MTIYSIEKVGSDYVVKADDQGLMKVGSRRRAAQLVLDASELLDEARPQAGLAAPVADLAADSALQPAPSIARERPDGA